jgi:hypothetical protein
MALQPHRLEFKFDRAAPAVQLLCSGCYALGLGVRQLAHGSHASRRLRSLDLDRRCAHSRVDRRLSNELGKGLPRRHHHRCRARSRVDHVALACKPLAVGRARRAKRSSPEKRSAQTCSLRAIRRLRSEYRLSSSNGQSTLKDRWCCDPTISSSSAANSGISVIAE